MSDLLPDGCMYYLDISCRDFAEYGSAEMF